MNVIEITESNYQDYPSLDIVVFLHAAPGAMGEMGAIFIIDRDGQIYHANYCYGVDRINKDHIKDFIPVFADLEHGLLSSNSKNPDWVSEYLGYGNTLVILKEISDGFQKKVQAANFQHSGELFQQWPGFVLDLIGKGDGDLTMNDIWDLQKKKS